ncbi:MAG: cytochrome c oxidase subunit II [Anaerolineae bacterium]|nr:cytochrome c oxidase subunit II [Anaerolineae bacterium]
MNSMNFSSRTIVIIAVTGVLLIAGGFIFAQALPIIFPPQASAEAQQIDELFRILLIVGGAIFLLVQGLLAFSVWRFRAKPGDTSEGIVLHGNTTLEIVWTAIPAVIVFVLTILSYQVFWSIQATKDGEVEIKAAGARFNWAFTYSAPISIFPETVDVSTLPPAVQEDLADDNALTITSPELHTYVGQPVAMVMEPRDVIHSFWVPAFRIKQDLIPGRVTTVRFTPTIANTPDNPSYPIRCAELCGANHGLMTSVVIVHPDQATFNEWIIPLMDAVIHPPTDPVIVGHNVLASNVYPCHTCHVLNIDAAQPWVGNIGPALNGVADRAAGSRSSVTGLSATDYLYQSIHDPGVFQAPGFGNLMPQLNVPECELQAMVAYLCTQSDTGQPQCSIDLDQYAQQCAGAAAVPALESTAEATSDASLVSEATIEATLSAESTVEATSAPTEGATAEATVGS